MPWFVKQHFQRSDSKVILDYPAIKNLTRCVVPTLFWQHTLVLPVLLGELLVQPHAYPKAKHAMAALGVVGLSYLFW